MVKRTKKHTERVDITYEMFMSAVTRLENKILQSNTKYEKIYGIPRGGLILAVCLAHRLKLPLITQRSSVDENTIIVDDICDTGTTLSQYKDNNKFVVVTKSTGLDCCPDINYAYGVADHIWIRFWWEVEDE